MIGKTHKISLTEPTTVSTGLVVGHNVIGKVLV